MLAVAMKNLLLVFSTLFAVVCSAGGGVSSIARTKQYDGSAGKLLSDFVRRIAIGGRSVCYLTPQRPPMAQVGLSALGGGGNMKRFFLCIWIGFVVASANAFAQTRGARQEQKPPVFSVDVASVDVLFTVTDQKGRSVRNLKQEQIKVYEDDNPQPITTFSAEAKLPLTIALLIDVSGSVRDKLRFEREAAERFFDSILIRGKDRALAITFDTTIELIQDYTDDSKQLAKSMGRIEAGGGTALYDAVQFAVNRTLRDQRGRRILVMITDGDDTASRSTLAAASIAAQRNDVIIYVISTNSSGFDGEKSREGDDVLRRLAEPTGGRVFSPAKASQLSSSFKDIAQELRLQYALSYSPTNPGRDGAYHQIRIEGPDKRYVVRARAGYYAPRGDVAGR
jgi:Ca-activated chloride channel family protein